MIEVKNLHKSFDGKNVLNDISATFKDGITNLIIGQSGSGKTVFMKCIVGLLTPDNIYSAMSRTLGLTQRLLLLLTT